MAGQLDGDMDDDDEDYDPEMDEHDDGQDEEICEDEDDGTPAVTGDVDVEQGNMEAIEAEDEEDEETRRQRAEAFKTKVLATVESLGAQWPSIQDQAWLKRVLKMMSIADDEEKAWFPWGIPALEPLKKSAASADPLEQQHALSILALYKDRAEALTASAASS